MSISEKLRLGVVQMTSTDAMSANLESVNDLYLRAVKAGAEVVAFPENTLFMRLEPGSAVLGPKADGPEITALEALVNRGGVPLMITTPVDDGSGRLRNSTLLFEPERSARIAYSKIHLFDVDVVGEASVRESDHFVAGEGPSLVEIRGWHFGLSICYDLRFSELYSAYAQKADVILVPSAFLTNTGEAHWHVLLRARAIEAQAYVAAPAQSGAHYPAGSHRSAAGTIRRTFGHSLVIDPWGKILSESAESPAVSVVVLERSALTTVRKQIPMASHRRLR